MEQNRVWHSHICITSNLLWLVKLEYWKRKMWKFFFFLSIYPICGEKIFIDLISRFFMEKHAHHIHEIKGVQKKCCIMKKYNVNINVNVFVNIILHYSIVKYNPDGVKFISGWFFQKSFIRSNTQLFKNQGKSMKTSSMKLLDRVRQRIRPSGASACVARDQTC